MTSNSFGSCKIALIGDYDAGVTAHGAIDRALEMAGAERVWIGTTSLRNSVERLHGLGGIWCVPGSPYASTDGALAAIRYAREARRPFLGTCGGFQHALIEYARNVCGFAEAEHAETAPDSAVQVIAPLACSLIEQTGELVMAKDSRIRGAYACERVVEGYHCSYGLNRVFEPELLQNNLWATAHDESGEVRGVELRDHPFFVATLFQPERRALRGEMPPLVRAFLSAVRDSANTALEDQRMDLVFRAFKAGDETAFRELNEAWIGALFAIEEKDREVLNDPAGKILDKGGAILVAVSGGITVGCCALLNMGHGSFELAKMAVLEARRGSGIGRGLLGYAVNEARNRGATRLFLETNSRLENAIHLYEAAGFKHLPEDREKPSCYARCDVAMEMILNV